MPTHTPLAQASFMVIGSRSSHGVPSATLASAAHAPLAGRQPPAIRQAEDGVGQTTPAQRSICAAKRACLRWARLSTEREGGRADIQVRKASFTTTFLPPFPGFFSRAPWIIGVKTRKTRKMTKNG